MEQVFCLCFIPTLDGTGFPGGVLSLPWAEQVFCWCFVPTLGGAGFLLGFFIPTLDGTGFLMAFYPYHGGNRVSDGVLSLPWVEQGCCYPHGTLRKFSYEV